VVEKQEETMTTEVRTIIVTAFILVTLVACVASPTLAPTSTPVPTPTPVPSLTSLPPKLARKWYLDYVVIHGESGPPFTEGLWIDIESTGRVTWSDGCNLVTREFILTDAGDFYPDPSGVYVTTLVKCIDLETGKTQSFPDHAQFASALRSVVAYEFREKRLWLYRNKTKSTALVFR
jgi:hypothetical protein